MPTRVVALRCETKNALRMATFKDKLDLAKDKLKNRTRHRRQRADQLRYRDEKIARLENEITELRLITDSLPVLIVTTQPK